MKFCKNCATEINDSSKICPNCGTVFEHSVNIETDNFEEKKEKYNDNNNQYMNNPLVRGPFNKNITLVLCVLLGWLGIHKLYERKYYAFILYFFTLGLSGVGIVYDFIKLLGRDKKYYASSIPFM